MSGVPITAQYMCTWLGDGKDTATGFRPAIADVPGFAFSCVGQQHNPDGSPVGSTVLVIATGDPALLIGNPNITAMII